MCRSKFGKNSFIPQEKWKIIERQTLIDQANYQTNKKKREAKLNNTLKIIMPNAN